MKLLREDEEREQEEYEKKLKKSLKKEKSRIKVVNEILNRQEHYLINPLDITITKVVG